MRMLMMMKKKEGDMDMMEGGVEVDNTFLPPPKGIREFIPPSMR